MSGAGKLRILVVDDHFIVRVGLRESIDTEPDMVVVGEAQDGAEALQKYRELKPDLILMDLYLPGVKGAEATAAILAEFPGAHVVALTISEREEDIWRALRAGAISYLVKTAKRGELIETIRAAARGRRRLDPSVAGRLAERAARAELTRREREVLELIVQGKSNREAGQILSISEVTVKRHVTSLLEKLHASDRTQAATLAIQRGIVHLE